MLSGAEPDEALDRLRLEKLSPEIDDHDLELRELSDCEERSELAVDELD